MTMTVKIFTLKMNQNSNLNIWQIRNILPVSEIFYLQTN